jgi:transposase InsO family protein
MAKLASRRQLRWCLQNYNTGKITSKDAAKYLGISQRRFQQVYKQYQLTGKIPEIGLRVGRPKKELPQEWRTIIKRQYEKTHCNALYLEKKIKQQHQIRISHRIIHKVLRELNYAQQEPAKQKRRKPWIRYEQTHSLSLVHTDYHYTKSGKYLCVVLNDASRKVLAAGEFDQRTTQNALLVLKQAQNACALLYPILAVVTDHGSEFYATRRDERGFAEHEFELYLSDQVSNIFCAA